MVKRPSQQLWSCRDVASILCYLFQTLGRHDIQKVLRPTKPVWLHQKQPKRQNRHLDKENIRLDEQAAISLKGTTQLPEFNYNAYTRKKQSSRKVRIEGPGIDAIKFKVPT